jgi:hypothetical protein
MDQICLPVFQFSLLILILVSSLVWGIMNYTKIIDINTTKSKPQPQLVAPPPPPPPTESQLDAVDSLATGELPPKRRDYRRLDDPLKEPRRRYTSGGYGPSYGIGNVNIDTRGYLEPYHMVGYLVPECGNGRGDSEVEDRMFKLFGRRTDKYEYEYYVIHHLDQELKIPLNISGDRELYAGSTVSVPGVSGKFKVQLYEVEAPKYIPF